MLRTLCLKLSTQQNEPRAAEPTPCATERRTCIADKRKRRLHCFACACHRAHVVCCFAHACRHAHGVCTHSCARRHALHTPCTFTDVECASTRVSSRARRSPPCASSGMGDEHATLRFSLDDEHTQRMLQPHLPCADHEAHYHPCAAIEELTLYSLSSTAIEARALCAPQQQSLKRAPEVCGAYTSAQASACTRRFN